MSGSRQFDDGVPRAVRGGLRWALLACALAGTTGAIRPAGAPEHLCDRLAQPPRQTLGDLPALAEGVDFPALRAGPARTACARAMAEAPDEMRFVAYAARAADRAGDGREAVRLYRQAAEQGHPLAQSNLGAMYEQGEGGLPRNDREAERLYRLASDQGFPPAQANLGTLYATGRGGLPRNDAEAVRLWLLAAEHDDSRAQTNLGRMYAEGRGGLARNPQEAARLWRLAAAQGSVEARSNLRRMGVR